jgi:hypothetical protein
MFHKRLIWTIPLFFISSGLLFSIQAFQYIYPKFELIDFKTSKILSNIPTNDEEKFISAMRPHKPSEELIIDNNLMTGTIGNNSLLLEESADNKEAVLMRIAQSIKKVDVLVLILDNGNLEKIKIEINSEIEVLNKRIIKFINYKDDDYMKNKTGSIANNPTAPSCARYKFIK